MVAPDSEAPRIDESVALGRNQFDLLTGAIEGLLALLVEDWTADVPIVRDPWEGAGPLGKTSGTGEVWAAINQARGVLGASARWDAPDFLADNERLRAAILDVLNAFDVYREDDDNEPFDRQMETLRAASRGRGPRRCPECEERLSEYDWCPGCLRHRPPTNVHSSSCEEGPNHPGPCHPQAPSTGSNDAAGERSA